MASSAINQEVIPLRPSLAFVGTPEYTAFRKNAPQRHTPFAKSEVRVQFNGQPGYGMLVSATMTSGCDLIGKMYLEWTIPEMILAFNGTPATTGLAAAVTLAPDFAYSAIEYVEIFIGANRIDRHYGRWLQIWNSLTKTADQRSKIAEVIGGRVSTSKASELFSPVGLVVNKDDSLPLTNRYQTYYNPDSSNAGEKCRISAQTVRAPLNFWFCEDSAQAIPLLALNVAVTVTVQFKPISDLAFLSLEATTLTPNTPAVAQIVQGDSAILTFTDTVYSSTITMPATGSCPPGQAFTYYSTPLTYMPLKAPSLVYTGYNISTMERALFIGGPSEYSITTLQSAPAAVISIANPTIEINFNKHVKELVWFITPKPYASHTFSTLLSGKGGVYAKGNTLVMDRRIIKNSLQDDKSYLLPADYVSDARHPMQSCAIMFEGNTRVEERDYTFYSAVQSTDNHTGVLPVGAYCYSFAINPEDSRQFSGQANMSSIKTIRFVMKMNPILFSPNNNTTTLPIVDRVYYFYCFGRTLDTLRVISGQAGLATAI